MTAIRVYLKELRAEFLPGSVLAVFLGTAIAHARMEVFDPLVFVLALGGVVLIHLGTNVVNDYFDNLSGNDPLNTQYVRPFTGGSRLIQDKLLTPRAVLSLSIALFAAAVAVGIVLASLRGPWVLVLGAFGIASGLLYVAPGVNLAGRGLGEIFIGLNFGVLTVAGSYFVQAREWSWESALASLPLAALIAAVVFINEFQDMNADARVGKRTLVVRMGHRKAARAYGILVVTSLVPTVLGAAFGVMPRGTLLALAALPLMLKAASIARAKYDFPKELAPANALTIVCYTLTGILLTLGYLLAK